MASTASFQPLPHLAAYAASKAYVRNFTEAFAEEMSDYGVSVSCLCRGATETKFFDTAGIDDSTVGNFGGLVSMTPKDVARFGYELMFNNRKRVGVPGLRN